MIRKRRVAPTGAGGGCDEEGRTRIMVAVYCIEERRERARERWWERERGERKIERGGCCRSRPVLRSKRLNGLRHAPEASARG